MLEPFVTDYHFLDPTLLSYLKTLPATVVIDDIFSQSMLKHQFS